MKAKKQRLPRMSESIRKMYEFLWNINGDIRESELMYRIMIVDDEPLILAGIASLLNWEEHQCRIVGKASNGQQALALLDTLRPDIVITDIKMPAMDGITFMKTAMENGSAASFILLTNLEEFSLAKEALHLGAIDYLVKLELSEESLVQALESAIERCNMNYHMIHLAEEPLTVDERIQNYFRRILIYDTDVEADSGLSALIRERYPRPALMLINFNYGFEGFSEAFTRADQKKVMGFAEDIISGMVKGFFDNSCVLRREQSGFVLVLSTEGMDDFKREASVMSVKFRQVMKDYFEVPVSIAVSLRGGGVDEIQDLLYQAMSAMNLTFYDNTGGAVFYSELCEDNRSHSSNFNINFLKKDVTEAIRQNDCEEFSSIMNQMIQLFSECRPSRRQAVNACNNLYYFITSLIEDRGDQDFPYAVDIVGQLNRMDNLSAVLTWLEGFRDQMIKVLENHQEARKDKIVELALEYVRAHYQEKITLSQAAAVLNVSQGHLSSTFKKQTGKNFSDYVTEMKIEKARELIESYQYRMYEISDMLGFDTPYYFSSVFKKITGYTPKEYENLVVKKL